MRDAWRHFAAEFVGTFALVFVGSGAIMTTRISQSQAGLVEVALAHGLILAVMVSALMRISGHFNPAVTLGLLATRRIEAMMAAMYIVAQLLGAIAAGYALKASFPSAVFAATRGGGQSIALDIGGGQAFILETIATFFLVFVVTSVSFLRERSGGTLERLMATPLRRTEIVLGYMLAFTLVALLQSALVLLFSLYGLRIHVSGSAALNAFATLTASWPCIASTTKSVSTGFTAA